MTSPFREDLQAQLNAALSELVELGDVITQFTSFYSFDSDEELDDHRDNSDEMAETREIMWGLEDITHLAGKLVRKYKDRS